MAESTGRNALADCIQRVEIVGQTDLVFNIECFTDDSGTTFYGVWELVDNTLVLNFYTVDAGGNLTPYAPTSTPVPCSPTDIEETQNCWIALADGVGYSTDDQIQQTHFWDTSAIPPTLLATTWYNQTTRQVIAAPPPQTDLGPCDESSDCHILCDTIPPLGDPIIVDAYPGVQGQTGNWQIANGGFTVDYDVTAPSESADILTGSDGGIAVRNSGVPNDGPVVVTVPAAGIDTWSIDVFDLDLATLERVMFDIAPIAFTNALQIDPLTFEGVGDGLLSQFTFPGAVTVVTVTRPDLNAGEYVLEQVTINPPAQDEETVVLFRRCFNTTPPTDTDLDGNTYITQGQVGLCGSKSVMAGCYEDENGNFFDAIVLLNDNGTISSVVINNVVTDVTAGNLVVGRPCEACCVPSGESETFQHVDLPHADIATDAGLTVGTTQYNGNLCGDNINLVPFDLTVVALEVTTSTEPIFTWSGVANGGPHEIVLSSSGTLRMGFASCDGGMNETVEFATRKPDRIFPGTGSSLANQAALDAAVLPIVWDNGNSSDATYFEWDNVTVVPFIVNSQDTVTMRGFVDAVTFDSASRWSVDDCCCDDDDDGVTPYRCVDLCDAGGGQVETVSLYPGADGVAAPWQVQSGALIVDVAASDYQSGTSGLNQGVALLGAGAGVFGSTTLDITGATGDVVLRIFSLAINLEFAEFNIAPIATVNTVQITPTRFTGSDFQEISEFTFPAGTNQIIVTYDGIGGGTAIIMDVAAAVVAGSGTRFQRCFTEDAAGNVTFIDRDYEGNLYGPISNDPQPCDCDELTASGKVCYQTGEILIQNNFWAFEEDGGNGTLIIPVTGGSDLVFTLTVSPPGFTTAGPCAPATPLTNMYVQRNPQNPYNVTISWNQPLTGPISVSLYDLDVGGETVTAVPLEDARVGMGDGVWGQMTWNDASIIPGNTISFTMDGACFAFGLQGVITIPGITLREAWAFHDCDGNATYRDCQTGEILDNPVIAECISEGGACCDEDAVYQHKVFDIINGATWTPADLPIGIELIEFSFSVIINAADNGVINFDATPAGNLPVGYSVHGRVLEGGVIEPPQIIDSGTAGRILVDATWRVP